MKEESNIENLKKSYKKIKEKYSLPDFNELNKEFSIEKISEIETDFLIREIRRYISEKFSNYLRFIELLLNPTNAPMFVFSITNKIQNEDRKKLTDLYKRLSKIEVELIELDLEYDDKREAQFIIDAYNTWQEIKVELQYIVKVIKENWENKNNNDRNYFG